MHPHVHPLRRLPTVILLVLLGSLTLVTWSDVDPEPVRIPAAVDGLHGITWTGAVSPTGALAVRITYDLGDDTPRQLSVRLPDGARYFALDGVPTEASTGVYATVTVAGTATVSYELPGAVTRYRDGALLRMASVQDGSLDGDGALFPCLRCYVEPSGYGDVPVVGALTAPGAEAAELTFVQLFSIRAETSTNEIRFAGIDREGDAVAMLATLPATAVPDLPVRDGTVGQALTAATRQIEDAGERVHRPGTPVHGSRSAAIAMSALLAMMLVAMVAWVLLRAIWTTGARAARRSAGTPDAVTGVRAVRPNDLEPALVAVLMGDEAPGERSVVAATLVELARRGVVTFSGNDDRRFTLTVPAGAAGASRFEQAVLEALRAGAGTGADVGPGIGTVERTGPPLWGDAAPAVTKQLRRTLARESMRQGLTRLSPAVLVLPATIAIGVLGIVGSVGGSVFAWIVTILGSGIALAITVSSALALTARGRAEQQEWARYADWLRTEPGNAHLAHAEPWDVGTDGQLLADATALGAAPKVAKLLSPRKGAAL